jgi:hypothetical protein
MSGKGLQLTETHKMALEFNKKMRAAFGDRVTDFSIEDVIDDPNHRQFGVRFFAYNYFVCLIGYGKGGFACSIQQGSYYLRLKNSQEWFDTANFDQFFRELKEELELRIPDKYLKANGW